jgi:WD40 repeat protein
MASCIGLQLFLPHSKPSDNPSTTGTEMSVGGAGSVARVAAVPLEGYGKRALWSPEGSHLLVTAKDGAVSVFEFREGRALVRCCRVASPDVAVGDAAWYPGGQCFVAASKHQPCLLRDVHGNSRASYVAYNAADEPDQTLSLAWSADGARLFGTTVSGRVAVWDPARPGRPASTWDVRRTRVDGENAGPLRPFNGVLSCAAWSMAPPLLAVGSYGGNVGLFGAEGRLQHVLKKPQRNGVTQVTWSDNVLLIGGRRSAAIVAYDMRRLEEPLLSFDREVNSHQHVHFAVAGGRLLSGDTSLPLGLVSVWELSSGEKLADLPLHRDVVASVDVHPTVPQLLATATGHRFATEPENCVAVHHVS